MTEKMRVAVVNSHPIQYFAPLYAFITGHSDIEITCLYCSDFSLRGGVDPGFKRSIKWDVDLLSGYPFKFLGAGARRRKPRGFLSLVCPELWSEIRGGGYDAVWLHGYAYFAFVLALVAAKSKGLPVFMRSETHLGLERRPWKRWLRDTLLSKLYRYLDGFLAIGTANRRYYESLGIEASRIFHVPYAVDNARFEAAAADGRAQRLDTRRRLGLRDESAVVLFASKFMPRKHPDDVIRAVASLQLGGLDVSLLLVGTGEMESELRELVHKLRVRNVCFSGFVNQRDLPAVYAACDVFVLPSTDEPWGLVVNEVMCAGLPVVVSAEVGCAEDLVLDGRNGRQFDARNVPALADALRSVLADPQRAHAFGCEGLAVIREWGYSQCLDGLSAAVQSVRER